MTFLQATLLELHSGCLVLRGCEVRRAHPTVHKGHLLRQTSWSGIFIFHLLKGTRPAEVLVFSCLSGFMHLISASHPVTYTTAPKRQLSMRPVLQLGHILRDAASSETTSIGLCVQGVLSAAQHGAEVNFSPKNTGRLGTRAKSKVEPNYHMQDRFETASQSP